MVTHAYVPADEEWSEGEILPELEIYPPHRQRRLTVLLRLFLAIPHIVVVAVLGLVAFIVRFLAWISALFLGRLPVWCGNFLRGYLAYAIRVNGYLWFLVDAYPPFKWNPQNYAIHVDFPPPTRLNRWAVFFRTILAIPIMLFMGFLTAGWGVAAIVFWLIVLVTGRVPQPIFEASAAILRVSLRTQAYYYMLTPAYLKGVFGDGPAPADSQWGQDVLSYDDQGYATGAHYADDHDDYTCPTRPLWLSAGGRSLMIVLLVLGVVTQLASQVVAQIAARNGDVAGDSSQNDVALSLRDYYRAVNANDGPRACARLSPALAQALMTSTRADNCPAAIDTTVRVEGQEAAQKLANLRYDARDVKISEDGATASIAVRDIYKANGLSFPLDSTITLAKNSAGDWILTSLG